MSIGNNIRVRRRELGLTQMDLGLRIHKSSQVISNWERGYTTGIAPEDLQALASALSTTVAALLDDTSFDTCQTNNALIAVNTNGTSAKQAVKDIADQRLLKLIKEYPHLDEKTKKIIDAIIQLSENSSS